jgi:hypothetical protein
MCLIIDTCCLTKVFDPKNQQHAPFAPVLHWITVGRGRMIYGGTKYNHELRQVRRIVPIIAELNRARRAISLPRQDVDDLALTAKNREPDSRFNDEHIVALVIASRCRLICTDDKQAIPYLKRKEFYQPYRLPKPKIYCYRSHKDQCSDTHVVPICAERLTA